MKLGNFETSDEAFKWNFGAGLFLLACLVGAVILTYSGIFDFTEEESLGSAIIAIVVFGSFGTLQLIKGFKIKKSGVWK